MSTSLPLAAKAGLSDCIVATNAQMSRSAAPASTVQVTASNQGNQMARCFRIGTFLLSRTSGPVQLCASPLVRSFGCAERGRTREGAGRGQSGSRVPALLGREVTLPPEVDAVAGRSAQFLQG